MEIKLTPEETELHFHNALCNVGSTLNGSGLQLDWMRKDYRQARAKLKDPCIEDVLLQILKDGKILHLLDIEGRGEYNAFISLEDVHENFKYLSFRNLTDIIEDNDDSITASNVIQTIFYKKIIFS